MFPPHNALRPANSASPTSWKRNPNRPSRKEKPADIDNAVANIQPSKN
jgi:hypothetical protein